MAEYDRLNFRKEWTDEVREYLKNHPEQGFDEDEVRDFVKFITNKYMAGAIGNTEEYIDEKLKELEEKIED